MIIAGVLHLPGCRSGTDTLALFNSDDMNLKVEVIAVGFHCKSESDRNHTGVGG